MAMAGHFTIVAMLGAGSLFALLSTVSYFTVNLKSKCHGCCEPSYFGLATTTTTPLELARADDREAVKSERKASAQAGKKDASYFGLATTPLEPARADDRLWIDSPTALEDVKSANISQWLKEKAISFIEQGYVVIPGHASPQQADAGVHAFKAWCEAKGEYCARFRDKLGHYSRLYNIHVDVEAFSGLLVHNEKTLQLMDFLFGRRSSVYTSILFSRGTSQPTHVDIPFFWTKPAAHYFGLWIALEDTDSNNGALSVLPRGHKCEILNQRNKVVKKERGRTDNVQDVDVDAFYIYAKATLDNCMKAGISEFKEVYIKKGDAILWHPLLPHGGSQIRDQNRSRFSLVSHIVPEMMHVYHADNFFNPDRFISGSATWDYSFVKDRTTGVQDYRLMMKTTCTFPPTFTY